MRRAWIEIVPESIADGDVRAAYEACGARSVRGELHDCSLANILAVHSQHPQTMIDHLQTYKTIMFGPSGVSRTEREIMAVVVSAINQCHY